ncbi:MAG: hypothetical protein JSV88_19505 [Candidatus Aminicenantes bacterium]|nr:MAG: hypothetical protein JSV88_19505 [Candidatus Aminicenantes bacterium]
MRGFILRLMIGCLVLSLATLGLFGQAAQPEVSLDDHPSNTNVKPFGPWSPGAPWVTPYMSAEDEFGLGLPASVALFLGPSPSLPLGPFNDSDILVPGPALLISFPPPPFYMDAISCDHSPMVPCGGGLFVRFSVDRATGGVTPCALPPATPVPPYDATYLQAWNNEQPADIYRTDRPYAHVGNFTGGPTFTLPPPIPWGPPGPPTAPYTYFYGGPINAANGFSVANGYPFNGPAGTGTTSGPPVAHNQLMWDHLAPFGFLPGPITPPPPPNQPQYPPITPGSHDNIDAFNEWPVSILDSTNPNNFFALHPASAIPMGFSPADIFICPNPPGIGIPPAVLHVPAWQMGLDTFGAGTDSIDGLAFWDNNIRGTLEPGTDYVAFSLAPGSATLTNLAAAGFQVSAASVFVSDFQTYIPPLPAPQVPTGYFYLWLYATDMGVGNLPNVASVPPGPLPVINPEDINIDGLDLTIDPEPVPYINPITKPITDPGTKK